MIILWEIYGRDIESHKKALLLGGKNTYCTIVHALCLNCLSDERNIWQNLKIFDPTNQRSLYLWEILVIFMGNT